MHRRNVFAGPYLDRSGHLRQDPAWFESALADSRSRAVPVWNSRNLVAVGDTPRAALIDIASLPAEHRSADTLILLGRFGESHVFAYPLEGIEPPEMITGGRFEDLRLIASLLPDDEAGLLGYARAMVSWRQRHRFCGACGSPTIASRAGHAVVCVSASCRIEQFPRIDPAIIVLVSHGEQALLGRQASWQPLRYSTIAGFVEPGESLEDAVAREVHEETGVLVEHVAYRSSQPWPFPSSLMLGFSARARSTTITRHDDELEDARWVSREDIIAGRVLTPPSQSISFRLIEHWFDAGGGPKLREVAARR